MVERGAGKSLLSFDLSHLRYEVAHFVAVQFGQLGKSLDVLEQSPCSAEIFAVVVQVFRSPEHKAVGRYEHLDQPGRGPVFTQQASEDRLEMIADLDGPKFAGAVLANLVGFTD